MAGVKNSKLKLLVLADIFEKNYTAGVDKKDSDESSENDNK